MNTEATKELFRSSPLISAFWPESIRARTLEYFPFQEMLNEILIRTGREMPQVIAETIHPILSRSSLRFPVYLAMEGNEPVYVEDFDRMAHDETLREVAGFNYVLGVGAIADRRFLDAEKYFAAEERISRATNLIDLRVYLLCMGGKPDDAKRLVQANIERYQKRSGPSFLAWLSKTFGITLAGPGQK
jgi:hypothetical protein